MVDFGQYDRAVPRQESAGKHRIGVASGATHFALVIDFHQILGLARRFCTCAVVRVLERGQHMPVGEPCVGVRMHEGRPCR